MQAYLADDNNKTIGDYYDCVVHGYYNNNAWHVVDVVCNNNVYSLLGEGEEERRNGVLS
jgi:hypothetical protein